jgi:hypothetical protein
LISGTFWTLASGLLGGGATFVAENHDLLSSPAVTHVWPYILATGFAIRGSANESSAASKTVGRKSGEKGVEQGAQTARDLAFQQRRIHIHGTRYGLDKGRVEGTDGTDAKYGSAMAQVYYLTGMALDSASGETNDDRFHIMHAIQQALPSEIAAAVGTAASSIEPTNPRTRWGLSVAAMATLGYELGYMGALNDIMSNPSHVVSYLAALGTAGFTANQLLAGTSGVANRNWSELPNPVRYTGIVTQGAAALAATSAAVSEAWDGHWPLAGATFIAGYGLAQLFRSAVRGEFGKEPPQLKDIPEEDFKRLRETINTLAFPGEPGPAGVGRPLWVPANTAVAGAGLLLMAAVMGGPELIKELPVMISELQKLIEP